MDMVQHNKNQFEKQTEQSKLNLVHLVYQYLNGDLKLKAS